MAWIESHDSLKEHPKLKKLARLLDISRPTAIGHLHMLWWWCLAYADDGDLSRFDLPEVADAAGWDGDPDALIQALVDAGFLDTDNGLHVHDWIDYAGKLVDRRERNRQAMRKAREQAKLTTAPPVDDTCTTRDDTCKATVPNRTVPTKPTNQPTTTVPDASAEAPADVGVVVRFWEENGYGTMSPLAHERLTSWVDSGLSPDLVLWALEEGVSAGARRLKYVEGILRNCHESGITTRQAAVAAQKAHRSARDSPHQAPTLVRLPVDKLLPGEKRLPGEEDGP